MARYPLTFQALVDEFHRLPGIGPKTAFRLALYTITTGRERTGSFIDALLKVKNDIRFCRQCHFISEQEFCEICSSHGRNSRLICVVEDIQTVFSIEETGVYGGLYHVLGGRISPLNGVTPDMLEIDGLLERVRNSSPAVEEIIIATNSDIDGEGTALYLAGCLNGTGVKTSRLAFGLPVGVEIEYTDSLTLKKALEGRNRYGS